MASKTKCVRQCNVNRSFLGLSQGEINFWINSKSYNQIENLYFYPSKRWDLKLKNNILLKLPEKLTIEYLDDLYQFLERDNNEKFTIVDARLKNQIILNE